jgi:RNA recognition motif-containing protein
VIFTATHYLLIVSFFTLAFSQVFLKVNFFYMNIYVSNLSFAVVDEDLRSYFAEYGDVTSAKVIMDKFTNRSKGFGFVEMSDDAAANKAIAELDGATVDGRSIKVSVAKPREERPARSNNSRPSYSGNNNNRW